MTLLILGLILWIAAHFFKRLMPEVRAALGDKGKGLVAITILAGVVLMVIGYRSTVNIPVYTPVPGIGHLNNLLMLIAIFLMGVGKSGGVISSKLRHPMLTGMIVWAVAHLLVNGDQASLVLFGTLGVWAILEMILINRGEGAWNRPATGPITKDLRVAVVTVVLFVIIALVHNWLGYSPFLGTYG